MKLCCKTTTTLLFAYALAVSVAAQQSAPGNTPPLDEGQQKLRDGQHAEALAFYEKMLADSPNSYHANNQAGVALDLLGQYEEARKLTLEASRTSWHACAWNQATSIAPASGTRRATRRR